MPYSNSRKGKSMKKLAIAAALSATATMASAQNVSVYGVIDTGIQQYNNGTSKYTRALDQGYTTSRLGFRGTEDLGGGLKAIFNLEGQLNPSAGQQGATTAVANEIFNREAFVGLAGNFGEIRVGRTDVSLASEMDSFAGVNANWNLHAVNGTAIEMGADTKNVVRYTTPNFGGLQVTVGHTTGNNNGATTDADASQTGVSVTYAVGKLKLGVGHHKLDAATAVAKRDMVAYAASYDFGFAQAGVSHARGDTSTTADVTSTATTASVKLPLSNGISVVGSYQIAKDGAQAANGEGRGYLVGLTKDLSKRTKLYASYAAVNNDSSSKMYINNITTAPAANGLDTKATTVGISHVF